MFNTSGRARGSPTQFVARIDRFSITDHWSQNRHLKKTEWINGFRDRPYMISHTHTHTHTVCITSFSFIQLDSIIFDVPVMVSVSAATHRCCENFACDWLTELSHPTEFNPTHQKQKQTQQNRRTTER